MLNYQRVGGTFLKWPDWIVFPFQVKHEIFFSQLMATELATDSCTTHTVERYEISSKHIWVCPKMGALKSHGLLSWFYWARTHVNMVEKINKPWLYLKQPRQDVRVAVWNAHCKRKANSAKVSFCIFLLSHHFRLHKSPVVLPIGSMVLVYMLTWIPSIYPKC
jgi:hypothetical protein